MLCTHYNQVLYIIIFSRYYHNPTLAEYIDIDIPVVVEWYIPDSKLDFFLQSLTQFFFVINSFHFIFSGE